MNINELKSMQQEAMRKHKDLSIIEEIIGKYNALCDEYLKFCNGRSIKIAKKDVIQYLEEGKLDFIELASEVVVNDIDLLFKVDKCNFDCGV